MLFCFVACPHKETQTLVESTNVNNKSCLELQPFFATLFALVLAYEIFSCLLTPHSGLNDKKFCSVYIYKREGEKENMLDGSVEQETSNFIYHSGINLSVM